MAGSVAGFKPTESDDCLMRRLAYGSGSKSLILLHKPNYVSLELNGITRHGDESAVFTLPVINTVERLFYKTFRPVLLRIESLE